jgi:hypothetical protein
MCSRRSPWSTHPSSNACTTFTPTCRINRYYDPTTDSFISVDPAVQSTDQPYVFVNGDPLNSTDPLGLQYGLGLRPQPDPIKTVTLKKSAGSSTSLSGQRTIDVPVFGGSLSISNNISVTGRKASSTNIDIDAFTGEVTASAGQASASFTPQSIASATPTLGWGSITTGNSAFWTNTKVVDGVTVTDTTTVVYTPSSWGGPLAGGLAVGVINPITKGATWLFKFFKDAPDPVPVG